MLYLFIFGFFCWLLVKAVGFAFRLTWGFMKAALGIFLVLAFPLLFVCVFAAGGILLLVKVLLVLLAVGILEALQ